jgi:hypothetical protein
MMVMDGLNSWQPGCGTPLMPGLLAPVEAFEPPAGVSQVFTEWTAKLLQQE